MKFKIDEKNQGLRIDKFLVKKFSEFSRKWLQKLIKEGGALVNNKKVKSHYILKLGDELTVNLKEPLKISVEPDSDIKIDIVYEDRNIIVVDKPAGIVVHPSQSTKSGTLVNGLLAIRPEVKNVGDPSMRLGQENLRPGILHRLDKETSGLLIIAKNNSAFQFLKNQFKDRQITKKYYALVVGAPKENEFTINFPIIRSKTIPTRQKAITDKADPLFLKAKKAETKIKVLKKFPARAGRKDYALIEAQPITGRMHQIRVHLAAIGNPVVGDDKYGKKYKSKFLGLKRNFLHAYYLKFQSPNGEIIELKSDLSEELEQFLKQLKNLK